MLLFLRLSPLLVPTLPVGIYFCLIRISSFSTLCSPQERSGQLLPLIPQPS